ncbi:uncharacterized protein LOC130775450 isoform X1 [Actinidia eriantha]|uniref:uncharacterized protein LOC130775450 isoform X1 n=1 Tax=Actinidia eriantha TaxID=165200 RepID=UPI0025875B35|nr:uncharacterized protein LOC130775450 isoform X1 [Actinidia eriantha]
MVRVQVKHGGVSDEQMEFLYECPTTSTIEEIARELTEISNLQSTIRRFVIQLEPRLSLHDQHKKVMTLHRALSEAKSYASQDQVLHNKPLSSYALKDHVKSVEREFSSNYRIMEFPDSSLQQLLTGLELLQEDKVELLWAGKKLLKGKQLCDYIGKNEKTKIVLRLQSPGSHHVFNSEAEPCGDRRRED